MNKGIIAINKPNGWTSFDVVNKIKHLVYPLKVGHLGTLDPMATGVLLVTVGKATKLFDIMQQKTKTYLAEFQFGYETDSLDATGTKTNSTTNIPTRQQIEEILSCFVGNISQVPPNYSAKSVGGTRAYDLARKNIEFSLPAKTVTINSIRIVEYNPPILKCEIVCGSGTYIRSIGRDVAHKLNSLATMTSLVRTSVGSFNLEKCQEIENLTKENVLQFLTPVEDVLNLEELNISNENKLKLLNGQKLNLQFANGLYTLKMENETVAIVEINSNLAKMSIFLG